MTSSRLTALTVATTTLLCATIARADLHKLPRYFKVCERNDPKFGECVVESVNNLRPYLEKGVRAFRIPPLNPLMLDEVRINEGSGPVSINLKLTKLHVRGGEQYKLKSVKNELDKYRLHFKLEIPILEMIGDYEMDGRALLLPLRGKGRANITVYDISPEATLIGRPEMRDGKMYMELEDFPVSLNKVRQLSLDFGNLFGGNKMLGDTTNRFLNENWRELMNEMQPIIEEVVSAFLISASQGIFHSVPFDNLFPEKLHLSTTTTTSAPSSA